MDIRKRVKRRLRELEALRRAEENLREQLALAAPEERVSLGRLLRGTKTRVRIMETALGALTPEERLVVDLLDIRPGKGNSDRLCQILQVEVASVYRRRDRAMQKLCMALYGRER